ncbi:putative DNA-binding protein [Pullulanibacillus sp. KACC 23026]|uniref:putative DNA-binding protein n=1 Tax=Pullulanibacillus sp. KACC 23026 TaxID=3028315 RepID=UPI0023B166E7|nr:putative DNA-binding protein [Pullulanibacillus sp. KACC 23026]WEG11610.1 putative DNA-binding protein [Pullulanibacillus sp. KACC 23026]
MLEKTVRFNALYDFYHPLLTEKQRDYMDLYYVDDYSLGEIAEEFGISRQAVYDNLKRTETTLESFEAKLGLYETYIKRQQVLSELRALMKSEDYTREAGLALLSKIENVDEEAE